MTTSDPDLLIVGAGPAGMSAAICARRYGLKVLVVDEQPEPGGQIWRAVERVGKTPLANIIGAAYKDGLDITQRFRACGAEFAGETTLWHIDEAPVAYLKSNGGTTRATPRAVLLATGAQERPTPFLGWTLPGVMTVGAGQILLKASGQVPEGRVWIAGTGPLAYLFATQLLSSGIKVSGFLDTRPRGSILHGIGRALAALLGQPIDIAKGLSWLARLRRDCRFISNVEHIAAEGEDRVERVTFRAGDGRSNTVEADCLFVHEGIIPAIHPTMALDCGHQWNDMQGSYAPSVDPWGETSKPLIFAAGDLSGIAGAKAACLKGQLAAIGVARKLGKCADSEAQQDARSIRKSLRKATAARPFLDQAYQPRSVALVPEDRTMACRCEEVTVDRIRALCRTGKGDPNRIKAFSRAGMGACQGRLCNYTVANVLADETGIDPSAIGVYRVRPPFKSLTLEELAALGSTTARP